MGSWGTGLYSNDIASDVREDFESVCRAPWDGEAIVAWARAAHPMLDDPTDDDHTDVRLVLADLLWTYGIDHPGTIEAARSIVAEGRDIAAKRALGMSERDLRQRSRVLDKLAARWSAPNPRPRPRRILTGPRAFRLRGSLANVTLFPLGNEPVDADDPVSRYLA